MTYKVKLTKPRQRERNKTVFVKVEADNKQETMHVDKIITKYT